MPLVDPQFVGDLDSSNPKGTDSKTITDDSIRNFKEGMRMSFPNVTGEVTSTHQDLNLLSGMVAQTAKPLPGLAGQSVYYLYNDTAPPGTTIEAPDGNIRNLVIGPEASGGTIGGSDNPTNMSDNVSVSISGNTSTVDVDDHRHGPGTIDVSFPPQGDENVQPGSGASCARQNHDHNLSGTTSFVVSGSTSHNHSFSDTGSGTASFQPRYARGILVRLNA